MKTKITLIGLSFLFSLQTLAQSPNWLWAKGIGGAGGVSKGNSIAVDASGNVYATGFFDGTVDFDPGAGTFNLTVAGFPGYSDIFICKLDNSGNFIWAKAMGGTNDDFGQSIAIDVSGNLYITGSFQDTVDFDPGVGTFNLISASQDIFILKLDGSGNFVWAEAMGQPNGGGEGYAITIDASSNVYTTGSFGGTVDFDPGAGVFNLTGGGAFISKLNSSGNFVWAKALSATYYADAYSIALDASGNVYTTGSFDDTVDFDPGPGIFNLIEVGGGDIFVCKLNSSGNFVWAKQMGGTQGGSSSNEVGHSIAVDASGNVYTTGNFGGDAGDMSDFDPGPGIYNLTTAGTADIFISKLNSSGNFVWAKRIGDIGVDIGTSIALDALGNIYTTGLFQITADFDPGAGTFNLNWAGGYDVFISKLDASGNFVWATSAGGTGEDIGSSIALDALGHAHVTGWFRSPSISFGSITLTNADSTGSTSDIFIAKLNNVVGIDELTNENTFQIYPNPTAGLLSIICNHLPGKTEIEIYNTLGEKIHRREILSEKTQINLSSQPAGIYFVRMRNNNETLIHKLIIQK